MGRKGNGSSSNALAVQVDETGSIKYDAIARRGHSDSKIIHSKFSDLIGLRQRAETGELDLSRPSEEQVRETKAKTEAALAILISGASAAQKPKNVNVQSTRDPTFIRYTPSNQKGDNTRKNDRIFKIMDKLVDPLAPPLHKVGQIPIQGF